MQIGKSNLFSLHTLLLNQEVLMHSPMDTLIVFVVLQMNADKNVLSRCHTARLTEMMSADIHASRTEVGEREFIQESTEISEQLKL